MAGGVEKLTALKVARPTKPGRYGEGKGLALQITKTGAKSWVFRFERPVRATPQPDAGLDGVVH